jgi:hypothetical protein
LALSRLDDLSYSSYFNYRSNLNLPNSSNNEVVLLKCELFTGSFGWMSAFILIGGSSYNYPREGSTIEESTRELGMDVGERGSTIDKDHLCLIIEAAHEFVG